MWRGYRSTPKIAPPFVKTVLQVVVSITSFNLTPEEVEDEGTIDIVDPASVAPELLQKTLDTDLISLQVETCRPRKSPKMPCVLYKASRNRRHRSGKHDIYLPPYRGQLDIDGVQVEQHSSDRHISSDASS